MFGGRMLAYWRDEALPAHLAAAERWKATDPAIEPDERLTAGCGSWPAVPLLVRLQPDDRPGQGDGCHLSRFLTLAAPGRRLTNGMFLRGFPSPTVDAETELEGLAEQLRDSDELRTLVGALQRRNCPTHSPADLPAGSGSPPSPATSTSTVTRSTTDFVVPTQAGDPLPVLISLKTMTQRPGRDPRARQRAIITERDTLVDATARSPGPLRRRLLGVLLDWAQRCGPDREQALFYMGAGWPALRRLALELGRRLAESGSLRTAEDIFFLQTPSFGRPSRRGRRDEPRPSSHPWRTSAASCATPEAPTPAAGGAPGLQAAVRSVRHVGVRNTAAQRPGGHDPAGLRRQPRPDECRCQRHPFSGRLLPDGARHVLVCDHDAGLDAALLAGPRHGDRCRRGPGPRLDRGAQYGIPAVLGTGSAAGGSAMANASPWTETRGWWSWNLTSYD